MLAPPCILSTDPRPDLLALKSTDPPSSELTYHTLAQGSSLSPNSTSLYAAFRVISLVNGFAKRLKSQTKRKSRKVRSRKGRQSRESLEQQAYAEVDAYLGRKTKSTYKRCKASRVSCYNSSALTSEDINNSLAWIQEEALQVGEPSLSTTAASNKDFLDRQSPFHLKHIYIQDLEAIVVAIKDLLATLRRASPPLPLALTFTKSEGLLDLEGESLYNTNLLHLLLCLQDQLLRTLIAQLFELLREHFIEVQRDRRRYSRDWFFEFPDSRHPLTTTWPWSIKASLAVIWGVCWMFVINGEQLEFDQHWNLVDSEGRVRVPTHIVALAKRQHYQQQQQQQQQQWDSKVNANLGFTEAPLPSTYLVSPQQSRAAAMAERRRQSPAAPQAATSSPSHYHHNTTPDQAANAHLAHHAPNTNNAYPQEGAAPFDYPDWPPQAGEFSGHQVAGYPLPTYSAYSTAPAVSSWQDQVSLQQTHLQSSSPTAQPFNTSVYPRNSPRRGPGHTAITPIRTNFSDQHGFLNPRPQDYNSSTTTSATSLVAPQEYSFQQPYNNTHLSPHYYPNNRQVMAEVQQPLSQPDGGHMAISPVQAPIEQHHHQASRGPSPSADFQGRKRSFSEMSQQLQPTQTQTQTQTQQIMPSPHNSSYGPSPVAEEETGPKAPRAYKRENAPMNADNKYYCAVSDQCSKLLFDRKCEWSKHMDKHDRPYTCQERECAKLQGFTYSGGLLRHEREVHGKHGGPKEQLRCTQAGCKRQTGKGFTRKENLNEHLRRVHNINIMSPDTDASTGHLKQIASDAAPGADGNDMSQLPYSQHDIDPFSFTPEASHKKRRYDDNTQRNTSEEVESELQHLRAENADKDERIRRLQEADAQKEERLQKLESILNGLQQAPKIDPEMTQTLPQPPPPAPMQAMQPE